MTIFIVYRILNDLRISGFFGTAERKKVAREVPNLRNYSQSVEQLRANALKIKTQNEAELEREAGQARIDAKSDLPIWLDAINRIHKKGETDIFFTYSRYMTDYEINRIKEIAPKLINWEEFCCHSCEYENFYACELQLILGNPFSVNFGISVVDPKPPYYEEKSFWSFSIRSD